MMNIRKKGKLELQKYYDLKLKKSTDYKSLFLGIVLTLVVVAPLILVLVQFFKAFYYDPIARITIFIIGWLIVMACNGISNVFMIKLAKAYFPEEDKLQEIDEKAIFVYQATNIGFALFTIALFILF